jgi:hypothetical protein
MDKTNKLIGLMIPDIGNYEEDIVNLEIKLYNE